MKMMQCSGGKFLRMVARKNTTILFGFVPGEFLKLQSSFGDFLDVTFSKPFETHFLCPK